MSAAGTTFELLVGTLMSPATLATFPGLTRTALAPRTVHRLRVGAHRDLPEIVAQLTEHDVELLEIRRCPEQPRRSPAGGGTEGPPGSAVVLPLRPPSGRSRRSAARRLPPGPRGGAEVIPFPG